MSGSWLPWRRRQTARRLSRYARREGGAPPADLLRRLRDDIPQLPAAAPALSTGRPERRVRPKHWVAAAALAAALTAGLVGLRVRQELSAPRPAGAGGAAAGDEGSGAVERRPSPLSRARLAEPPVSGAPAAAAAPAGALPTALQHPSRGAHAAAGTAPAPPAGARADRPAAVQQAARQPLAEGTERARPAAPAAAATPPLEPGGSGRLADEHRSQAQAPPAAPPAAEKDRRSSPAREDVITVAAEAPLLDARGGGDNQRSAAASGSAAAGAAPAGANTPAAAGRTAAAGVAREAGAAASAAGKPAAVALKARAAALGETESKSVPPPAARPAEAPPAAAPALPQKSFGADTGTGSYDAVRRELLRENRLPRPATVQVEQLANAFERPSPATATGRPELVVEGARLPGAGGTYLLRLAVHGMTPTARGGAVEVDFDPAVVARWRRVGATAQRGGATALFEITLRSAARDAVDRIGQAEGAAPAGGVARADRAELGGQDPRQLTKADQVVPADRAGSLDRTGQFGPADWRERIVAVVRLTASGATNPGAPAAPPPPAWAVRFSSLRPSWQSASPALRVPGLAVQLGKSLATGRPPLRELRQLRGQAQELAEELPDDPRTVELLRLLDRAADLAGAAPAAGTPPRPPSP